MKIEFSVFANSAILTPDGLFSLLGGGIELVTASSYPASVPNLCLLVRLILEPNERDKTHECIVKVFDPDGNIMSPDLVIHINDAVNKLRGKSNTFTAHFRYDGFTLPKSGTYRFHIMIGDQLVGEAVLGSEESKS